MLSQGFLNPIETVRAKLQEQIANFLAGRAKLIRLMSNPSLTVKGQAQGLYAVQTELENQLQNEIMPKIQQVSSGAWDLSDALKIGNFTTQVMKQINDVSKLEMQVGGVQQTSFMDMQTMAIGVPALIALGLLGGFMWARR
jgi:hypothetical protein